MKDNKNGKMIYRRELVDLSKDSEETRMCMEIVALSLVPGPPVQHIVKISDETQEGRNLIIEFLKKGYKVLSIEG